MLDDNNLEVKVYKNEFIEFEQLKIDNENKDLFEFISSLKDVNNDFINAKESLLVNFNERSKINPYKVRSLIESIIKEEENNFWPKKGYVIGRCKIVNLSGKGSTSNVYRAIHEFLGIEVAVKILSDDLKHNSPEIEAMFLQEAINTAKLNHPNLVSIFDADKGEKYTYMVMEFVNGIDLEHLINNNGVLDVNEAIMIMIKLCDALSYALDNNIIHRDIKPGNIMISKNKEVKLLDLGLSKIVNNKNESEEGNIVGTPIYMSPEQFLDSSSVDHRADLYSLGATFFHLLTGMPPFKTKSYREIITQKFVSDEFSPKLEGSNYPDKMKDIVNKLLLRDKNDRYQSYESLKYDLLLLT
ncbi:MAG: serine/threonine protein kinase [Candidatus Sericytochromatia bacterium]|nr:serine/threonine protein kinase [Candidatus Sericytochromatia bacterium]